MRNVTLSKVTSLISVTIVGEFSLDCKGQLSSGVAMKCKHTGELHRMHGKKHDFCCRVMKSHISNSKT